MKIWDWDEDQGLGLVPGSGLESGIESALGSGLWSGLESELGSGLGGLGSGSGCD